MRAGLELAKNVPSLGGKVAVVIGTALVAQAVNVTTNKIVQKSSTSDTTNNFISLDLSKFINENQNNSIINEKFSEYPYNLIPDLNMYVNIEIWFIIILINILLTSYLLEKKIDINKLDLVKNERLKKIINYVYNRYISVWSFSRNILIIWSILMLLLCIFMSKLILFLVFSV
jgi:hypothetical protein